MWKWLVPLAVGIAIAVAFAAIGTQSGAHVAVSKGTTTAPTGTTTGGGPTKLRSTCASLAGPHPSTYAHVIWIWLSDESYSDVIGNARGAPYTNALADQCGLATGYYAITHPGPPNAVAALSGGTQGITHNACATCTTAAASLLNQVGGSWRVYAQSMPRPCDRTATPLYVPTANPATYFSTVDCAARDLPLGTPAAGAFATALRAGTLPRFTMLIPDACNSGSARKVSACPAKRIYSISRSDAWMQSWVRRIVAGSNYQSGSTVIVVTWDEGSPPGKAHANGKLVGENCPVTRSDSCHVATLVISPYVQRHHWVAHPYTHYSLLRTTEQLLGIGVYLGDAAHATGMRQAFGL